MAFERYKGTRRGSQTTASIWSSGQIGFNQGAVAAFHMADYRYAVLFFETATRRIGVRLTNQASEPGAQKLLRETTSMRIHAPMFLDHHHIDYRVPRRYALVQDAKAKLLIFDLRAPLLYNRHAHHDQ